MKNFVISGIQGFNIYEFISAMKTRYESLEVFKKQDFLPSSILEEIEKEWDVVPVLDFGTCMKEPNIEKRRAFFSCLGPEKIFNSVKHEHVDTQTITKKRMGWDEDNKEIERVYDDTYILYKIDRDELISSPPPPPFLPPSLFSISVFLFIVNCKCTTTGRDYWIMIENEESFTKDAISAIASTIRIREKHPKRIYRQGDVIIVEKWGDERDNELYWRNTPLTKEQYLNLIYSET